jgi:peptidoglycan/LPS O-acetylase OafA/YrhL
MSNPIQPTERSRMQAATPPSPPRTLTPQPKTTPQPRGRSSYIPGLDGIRAIAFLLVFWAHALPDISYYIPATLGVTIFFFLSGYLITTLLRKELDRTGTISLRDFYIRRALRIFVPLYVVYALVSGLACFVLHVWPGNRFGFFSMLFYFYNYANVMRWHAWLPPGMSVIWSLAVEEHFYILFPLVLLWMTRRRLARSTQTRILVILCVFELVWRFILIAVIREQRLWTYFATDARLDSILWGCILALRNNPVFFASKLSPKIHPDRSILPAGKRRRYQPLVFAGAVMLLAASLFPRSVIYKESLRYTVQALALYVIFSFVIANIRHWSVAWLEWLPLRYIGWISYVLYLSHDFILSVTVPRFPGRFWISGPIAFVLSVAFATLMRYTLELPLQTLRARFRRVPEADPTAADGHGLVS